MEVKEKSGCLMIAAIFLSAMIVAGLFYFVGGKLFGEEYRILLFFGTLGTIGIVFLIRELMRPRDNI